MLSHTLCVCMGVCCLRNKTSMTHSHLMQQMIQESTGTSPVSKNSEVFLRNTDAITISNSTQKLPDLSFHTLGVQR